MHGLVSSIAVALCWSAVSAQQLVEKYSFGYGNSLGQNNGEVPGWRLSGDGGTPPQVQSNKIVLSPLYPGNKRGAVWADSKLPYSEWTVEFEFRTSGPERGGGNLQLWYAKDGPQQIQTSSIYTVEKFDGLVLVVDTHGGKGGSIRGFLNDGSVDYSSRHGVDGMAFGHCDYPYRNLGRQSLLKVRQTKDSFDVTIDDQPCFSSNKVVLPQDYQFGITAASADTPDSFEAYRFSLLTPDPYAYQVPPSYQASPPGGQQQYQGNNAQNQPASYYTSQDAQFADLHNRLQGLTHAVDNMLREISVLSQRSEQRHRESLEKAISADRITGIDQRLQRTEDMVRSIKRDLENRDYGSHFSKLQDTLRDTQSSLIEHLPQTMSDIVTTSAPRMGFFIFVIVVVQLGLAGSYVLYKKRRANAPKKFL